MSDSEDQTQSFSSKDEEITYWKRKASDYRKRMKESIQELEEYQTHSSELEAELEAELEQSSGKCSELRHQVAKLATENEQLKDKLATQSLALEGRVDSLEEELQDVRSIKDGLTAYIRQLEQANDDLERAKRATVTSLEDFEARLNQAIERNAFLESELDEKETLKEMVQRLKDESRDLKQEVLVRDQLPKPFEMNGGTHGPDNDLAVSRTKPSQLVIDSNKLVDSGITSPSELPVHRPYTGGDNTKNGVGTTSPITPSARLSALNIVGDLLRKVGALETRLASCRTLVKDNNGTTTSVSTSNSASLDQLTKSYSGYLQFTHEDITNVYQV